MEYFVLKHIHVTLAVVSVVLYLIRAALSLSRSRTPSLPFRVITHLVDTLLLGLGVTLAYKLFINPLDTPWLAMKLLAILAYIVCGTVVMKGKKRQVKLHAMVLSLVLIAYIFTIALTKDPFNFRLF